VGLKVGGAIEFNSPSVLEDRNPFLGRRHVDDPIKKGIHFWILMLIIAIGALVRFYHIDVQSLSHDEIGRIGLCYMGIGDLFDFILYDGHAPGYLLFLKAWMRLLPTEMTSRYLSIFLGLLFIPAIYLLSLKLFDRRVALFSATLSALSPFHIYFSQDGNLYTMMMLLSVLAMISFVEILSNGSRPWWIVYLITVTSGLYTHLFTAALPVLTTLFLFIRWRTHGRLIKRWIVCHTVIGIAYLPWLLVIIMNIDKPTGLKKSVGFLSILYTFFTYSVGFTIGPSVTELQQNTSLETVAPYIPIVLFSAIVFSVIAFVGIFLLKKKSDILLFLLLFLFIPIIFVYGISSVSNVSYNVRYVCVSFPAYLMLLSYGLSGLRNPARIFLCGAVLFLFIFSLKNFYFDSRYFTEDMRSTAAYIERSSLKNDAVFIISTFVPFYYYFDGDIPIDGLSTMDMTSDQHIISKIQRTIVDRSRLWMVLARSNYCDPNGAAKRYLDQHFPLLSSKAFPGTEVYCYQLY